MSTEHEVRFTTREEIEEQIENAARLYVSSIHGVSGEKINVIYWPSGKYNTYIQRGGVTATLYIGVAINHKDFGKIMRGGLDHICKEKLYESTAIELRSEIERRNKFVAGVRVLPGMLRDDEITIKVITTVELTHNKTGQVIKDSVTSQGIGAVIEKLRARLSYRVAEEA